VRPYDASSITVLAGLEAVRRRPAMYIGSSGAEGAEHLVLEVVQNAVDEVLAGACTHLSVRILPDGTIEVADDGRGIPTGPHPATGRPASEIVLTTLHAGGKFGHGAYRNPGGVHGVGLSCVNALSELLEIEISREGARYHQRFRRGVPEGDLDRVGSTHHSGTTLRFRPDPEIFGEPPPARRPAVRAHLRALAFLFPELSVHFEDADGVARFREGGGVAGLVAWLAEGHAPVHAEPLVLEARTEGVTLRAALQWTSSWTELVRGYVNGIPTHRGAHVDALEAGLTRAVQREAAARGLLREGERLAGYDVREGLCAVLELRMDAPEFEGQTKARLTSPALERAAAPLLEAHLSEALRAAPVACTAILARAIEASRVRANAQRARERTRYRPVQVRPDLAVYREQFGIRSRNWHASARWLTDTQLLSQHAEAFVLPGDSVLLDVCCGSGVVGASFRGRVARVVGLDLTPQMVELARTRLDEVVLGDVYDIPFPDASFDAVCNREVLHLLPHPERPLAEVFRVLKPGGQLIVGQLVPYGPIDAPWFFRVIKKKQPLLYNHLLQEDLASLLAGAGFVELSVREVLQWEDIDTWIDTWETPLVHRHQIRALYQEAPACVRAVHPFRVTQDGRIEDCWRWVIFSARKPGLLRGAAAGRDLEAHVIYDPVGPDLSGVKAQEGR
jgi:DNA gyrase subunit B